MGNKGGGGGGGGGGGDTYADYYAYTQSQCQSSGFTYSQTYETCFASNDTCTTDPTVCTDTHCFNDVHLNMSYCVLQCSSDADCGDYNDNNSMGKTYICDDGYCQLECDDQCETCIKDPDYCLTCTGDNRNLGTDNSCSSCLPGYIEKTDQEDCESCDEQCETCEISQDNCLTCKGNYRKLGDDNSCSTCNDGYYEITDDLDCHECDSQCETCQGSSDNCLSCVGDNRILGDTGSTDKCINCKPGYYQEPTDTDHITDCQSCDKDCLTCEDSGSNCLTCNGQFRSLANSPKCSCDIRYFDNGTDQDCQICDDVCLTCSGQSHLCDSCNGLNRNKDLNCICKDGFYENSSVNLIDGMDCKECKYNCGTCDTFYDNCQTCQGLNRNHSSTPNCNCMDGYYDDGSNMDCLECDYKCSLCEFNSDNCLECSDPTRDINNNCQCKTGYFEIEEDQIKKCMKCDYNCLECEDTSDNCTICKGKNRNSFPDCDCQNRYQDDNMLSSCYYCGDGCLFCKNKECLQADGEYYIYQGTAYHYCQQ